MSLQIFKLLLAQLDIVGDESFLQVWKVMDNLIRLFLLQKTDDYRQLHAKTLNDGLP